MEEAQSRQKEEHQRALEQEKQKLEALKAEYAEFKSNKEKEIASLLEKANSSQADNPEVLKYKKSAEQLKEEVENLRNANKKLQEEKKALNKVII
jgi:hypothetical protein